MNRHQKKRKELQWRIVQYILMVATIATLATFFIMLLLGYRFNNSSGEIQQGGLVQFVSEPNDVNITVGSANLVEKTPSKITVNPGDYLVKMELDGYELWQKNISVEAGKVLWLNSAKLIPRDIVTEPSVGIPRIADSFTMPGSGYISILPGESSPNLTRYDIRSETVKVESFDASTIKRANGKKNTYAFIEWNGSPKRAVIKHVYDNKAELLFINFDSISRSTIAPAVGKALPLEAIADPRSDDDMVVRYSDGTVRLIGGSDGTVSDPILTNILSMNTFGSSIVYVKSVGEASVETGYLTLDNKKIEKVLQPITTKLPVRMQVQKYFDTYFLTTIVGTKVTVQKATSLPSSSSDESLSMELLTEFSTDSLPINITSRDRGQQISIAQASGVTNFDTETNELTSTTFAGKKSAKAVSVEWLDEFHYYTDIDGTLRQYEYDGTNQGNIVPVATGQSAGYSRNGTYLYSIKDSDVGYILQRSTMILDK